MSKGKLNSILSASLKSGVAMLPLAIAFAQMPASAQPKSQAQLEAEAAAAKAAAATGAEADDAEAAALLFGGLTGASKITESSKDIVVTGTNIRGVPPVGTNLTVITKEDIAATGQTSVNQLLATIPGFTTFNDIPNNGGAAAQGGIQVQRPNLRGTPDGDLAGALGDPGSSTLILVDGNRQSAGGSRTQGVDPESIPTSLLERVEINTDGGSASYGSDATGGVVNFVTRRRYDGVEVQGRLGYADDYWRYDGSLLVGKDWGSGSAYITPSYAGNTPLYNRTREYLMPVAVSDGLQTSVNCNLPNIQIAGAASTGSGSTFSPTIPTHFYRVNADGTIARSGDVITNGVRTTAGTGTPSGGLATSQPNAGQPSDSSRPNLCTPSGNSSRVNKNKRYGVNLNFYQKITDDVDFLLRGGISWVDTLTIVTPITLSIPVSVNNPFRQELRAGANGTGTTQASYPTAQVGFPTPLNDVARPCTSTATCTLLNGVVVASGTPGAVVMPIGTLVGVAQTVLTSQSAIYGPNDNFTHLWSHKYGGTGEVTWRIDGNWQLKLTGTYDRTSGKSLTNNNGATGFSPHQEGTVSGPCTLAVAAFANAGSHTAANAGNANAIALREAAKRVCINPYNPEASDPVVIAAGHSLDSRGLTHNAIINGKFNLDGALFQIPGGKVKVAFGGEYLQEYYEAWAYSVQTPKPFSVATTAFSPITGGAHGSRWIYSVYGEANIPLISRANELTWIKEFRVNIAARYDKIKFFGETINPRLGVTFKPTNWLSLRGSFSTSFRAPVVRLSIAAEDNNITITAPTSGSIVPYNNTNPSIFTFDTQAVTWSFNSGAPKNLKPTTGKSWSFGMELTPFRGFRANVSYGHIDYYDALNSPNIVGLIGQRGIGQGCSENRLVVVLDPREQACSAAQITAGLPAMHALTPAEAQAAKDAFLAQAANAAQAIADGRPVYGLYDLRFQNTGNSKIGTVDYSANYNSRTPWGNVFFSVQGSVRLINKSQANNNAPFNENSILNGSRHGMTARAGFTYGPLNASATLTHSDGYGVNRSANSPQDKVGAYNVINTFFTWDFKGDNVVERGLQLSLAIENIFNTPPPVRYTTTVGTANGSTLGRLVQAGFRKKF